MSEVIQSKRRTEKTMDWLATLLAAAMLAFVGALLMEGVFLLIGLAIGDPVWHRSLVEQRITKLIEWLEGVPVIGIFGTLLTGIRSSIPQNGFWRDLSALGIMLYSFAMFPAKRIGPTLIARYDDEALREKPPIDLGMRWAGPLGEHQQAAWDQLRAWCFKDIGTGAASFWMPWRMPDIGQPFAIAVLSGINGVGKSHLVEALSRELDGSLQLEACASTVDRWRLKLRIKFRECLWWRARRPDHPWDCGYLVEDAAARKRLDQFSPRRCTLIVADEPQADSLIECLADLSARRADFRHPVRLLVIDAVRPSALQLAWDTKKGTWWTALHDIGEVTTLDLSGVRFDVAQFRGLVGAQNPQMQENRLYLTGGDARWRSFVEALDYQPILETEAIRLVKDDGVGFDDLLMNRNLPDDLLTRREQSETEKLPPDLYGKTRDLLRERILSARAEHREAAIKAALGVHSIDDAAYSALMVASMANGATVSRLNQALGGDTARDCLGREQIAQVFGSTSLAGWVPPIKPAIIADELLRRYFNAPRAAALAADDREKLARAMRAAWLANPAGAVQTARRWSKQGRQDEFSKGMQRLPELKDLRDNPLLSVSQRIELVRGLFELAIFAAGDIAPAQAALDELADDEIPAFEQAIDAQLTDPKVHGLPALCLWLRLVRRRFSMPETLPKNVDDYLIALLERARGMVRQVVVVYSPTEPFQELLLEAVAAVLPVFARIGIQAVGNVKFRKGLLGLYEASEFSGQILKIRLRIIAALGLELMTMKSFSAGEPEQWVQTILKVLEYADIYNAIPKWQEQRVEELNIDNICDSTSLAWGQARTISLYAYSLARIKPVSTAKLAKCLSGLVTQYYYHKGIQFACAQAWHWVAFSSIDLIACTQAADWVSAIAGYHPDHEDIQWEHVKTSLQLISRSKNTDLVFCEKTTCAIGKVAGKFPEHLGMHISHASALGIVSWIYKDVDPMRCEQASLSIQEIVRVFYKQEHMQWELLLELAAAWSNVAFAYQNTDPARCERIALMVQNVANSFPQNDHLQLVHVRVWRIVAFAYSVVDAERAKQATQMAWEISQYFPKHEEIHFEYIWAVRNFVWGEKDRDAARCELAARAVLDIALAFPNSEDIQWELTRVMAMTAWAQKDNIERCEQIVQLLREVASQFPLHKGIQFETIQAWGSLVWAYKDVDVRRCEQAAKSVREIACDFPWDENFQIMHAQSLRLLTWSQRNISPADCEGTARLVHKITLDFPRSAPICWEDAQAWRNVSKAYKDIDALQCELAAQFIGKIAIDFVNHEGIQDEYVQILSNVLESAIHFDNWTLIERIRLEFDRLTGKESSTMVFYTGSPPIIKPEVLKVSARAYATYEAWRRARGEDGTATGARTEA